MTSGPTAWEGLIVTACAVGTFGDIVRRNLKKGRQERTEAAIKADREQQSTKRKLDDAETRLAELEGKDGKP